MSTEQPLRPGYDKRLGARALTPRLLPRRDSGCSARCLNINEGDCFDAQPGQQWRCFEKYAGAEEAATAALSSEEVTEA